VDQQPHRGCRDLVALKKVDVATINSNNEAGSGTGENPAPAPAGTLGTALPTFDFQIV
jgi:hypothetical protein